ncbi:MULTISPECIES: YdcF family protein [Actinobacillus]|uniref:DUF218 domain-containing protein n=2 Tax=Actinobacillus suis TaxID=716 RepID=K0FVI5_ACTSU|nr:MULTISPECIES: YdcF family protein [Actinobacillus]AFU18377.1 hypothetical protein ASU2_01175 [Actinobacillus suis H91-0380]AIJ30513.1 hypothetical protein ASU1_01180 [Actinobacillus suis ATCC 33415]MCO4167345.1 YdcF family protein [Actinobacillus suis]MCO4169005.1 YdcF family protein [Actinobacillus suis]MCQ9629670.1 YdcF family protein [Actinobacillus suis]
MFFLTKLLTSIILPPFSIALLWILSLILARFHYKKLSRFLAAFGIIVLYLISTPLVATKLSDSLVTNDNLTLDDYRSAQAIVVLSGGMRDSQELFGNIATGDSTLDRMRYGAFLTKETSLPILVTGSSPNGNSEAAMMAKEFEQFFQVKAKWLEEKAKTTKENAQFSREMLAKEGINKIVLVTNQWHMKRAKMLFEKQGFEVLPASTGAGVTPEDYYNYFYYLPQAGALSSVMISLKEWMGYLKESL